jgi:hypothetical protein
MKTVQAGTTQMARSQPPELFTFIVEGNGVFPFDMMRYDQCWPYTGEDSAKLDHHYDSGGIRRVTMQTFGDRFTNRPTRARWASFTWRVLD